jgi:predicted dehydrogenase
METFQMIRVGVVGAGAFGKNHLRVFNSLENVRITAVADMDAERAQTAAAEYGAEALTDYRALAGKVDAAVVAAPTTLHAEIGLALLEAGIDVLIEKPIAATLAEAEQLTRTADRHGRVLQVGHLERFNPAVMALEELRVHPLFFEIHRLSLFTPRSLDVDVVLDLMIHDLEIVLALAGTMPEEIRAAGIRILSERVDIANVRIQFPGGCIANLTASRASTEQVRKLRVFAPSRYLSLDYSRKDLVEVTVGEGRQIGFRQIPVAKDEPLRLELADFVRCVRTRSRPRVSGVEATRALEVALRILDNIEAHAQVVARSLGSR